MIQKLLSIAFYLVGALFLGFVVYLIAPSQAEVDATRVSFALAASFICFAFANIERVSSLGILGMKITLSEAKKVVAEANVALEQLRSIAVVFSEVIVEKLQSEGRFGGSNAQSREEQKQYLISTLKELKVPISEIKKVEVADRQWVKIDYVEDLFWNVPGEVAQNKTWGEWWAVYHKGLDRPDPDECASIMKEYGLNSSDMKEVLKDYRHYMRHGKHRRPEYWFSRYDRRRKTST